MNQYGINGLSQMLNITSMTFSLRYVKIIENLLYQKMLIQTTQMTLMMMMTLHLTQQLKKDQLKRLREKSKISKLKRILEQ